MTVAFGTNGDMDPLTFAEYEEAVLRSPEALCVGVGVAGDDDDEDEEEEVLVDAAVLFVDDVDDVGANVFACGAEVMLYTLIYHVPPQIWAVFPRQGTPHQYSSTRSGFSWAKRLPQ